MESGDNIAKPDSSYDPNKVRSLRRMATNPETHEKAIIELTEMMSNCTEEELGFIRQIVSDHSF